MALTEGSLAALEGIQLQLAASLVGPNVQISGIDASSINNITLQVGRRLARRGRGPRAGAGPSPMSLLLAD